MFPNPEKFISRQQNPTLYNCVPQKKKNWKKYRYSLEYFMVEGIFFLRYVYIL